MSSLHKGYGLEINHHGLKMNICVDESIHFIKKKKKGTLVLCWPAFGVNNGLAAIFHTAN